MNWYTSDWHLNETRITQEFNPFFRPFQSIEEQNNIIISNCNKFVNENDTLYHLGDVSIDIDGISLLSKLKVKKRILIVGNYDEDKLAELGNHFDDVQISLNTNINNEIYHLNHYPVLADNTKMNIVGHIHGLWKVQPRIINVGVDAWHFQPIDENRITFITNAMRKFYDKNVFPLLNSFELKQFQVSLEK